MNLNNSSAGEDSDGSEEHYRENLYCLRQYLNHHKQTVGRNTDIKGTVDETSESNEEHVIGNQQKADPCYIGAESLESYNYMESRTCK